MRPVKLVFSSILIRREDGKGNLVTGEGDQEKGREDRKSSTKEKREGDLTC